MLEDAFWESTFSSYTQDEYVNLLVDVNNMYKSSKNENAYNLNNRLWESTPKAILKPFFRDHISLTNLSTLPLYTEESYTNSLMSSLNNFNLYDTELEVDTLDGSYNNVKSTNYIYNMNYMNTLNTSMLSVQPLSYTQVLNPFRAGFEESTLSTDADSLGVGSDVISDGENNDLRVSNPIKLRSTAKNAIVTFNALQKVFRPRFDEGRSNVHFSDLSNTFVKYPFLSESRTSYEQLLGKNKESFFYGANYNNYLSSNFNNLSPLFNSLNIYFANIPFLLSTQSDASRYMWFD